MNKIVFLKILIAVITFLIFLTLGGIVYALINYKTMPKILSHRNIQTILPPKTEAFSEIYLGLTKEETIKDSHSCGNMLCLRIGSDFQPDKIIIFDPNLLQIKAVLNAGQKKIAE